jgi:hypothetical protein
MTRSVLAQVAQPRTEQAADKASAPWPGAPVRPGRPAARRAGRGQGERAMTRSVLAQVAQLRAEQAADKASAP